MLVESRPQFTSKGLDEIRLKVRHSFLLGDFRRTICNQPGRMHRIGTPGADQYNDAEVRGAPERAATSKRICHWSGVSISNDRHPARDEIRHPITYETWYKMTQ